MPVTCSELNTAQEIAQLTGKKPVTPKKSFFCPGSLTGKMPVK